MARTGRPREFDRESAVRQAMNLFWAKGFESTSLSDLKSTLGGLSSASFYAAFGSKKALYEECLAEYMGTCGELVATLRDESLSAREALRVMLWRSIEIQTSRDSPLGCMAVLSGIVCDDDNADVAELARNARKVNRDAIADCLARGVANGELADDGSAEAFTLTLDSFLKGLAVQSRDGISREALLRSADQLLSILDR
ncbi:TetR/AcrR family transcriptional regulator [Salinicola rhizosphaerae]|uniref:TetR family transcriptional regulator n=1 Tax=Salinicola rhizosphaerae TaxID=1443141 RepID=A0ABQ3DWR9_9GAMM|nr:TetR/AcrR family transcriptional regulator [Salinicola rhizosphaerae]GHB18710.1 TetR family transcriptional regulator [Salinicola rhizosphaerae]